MMAFVIGSPLALFALPLGLIGMATWMNRVYPLAAIDGGLTTARKRATKRFVIALIVAVAVAVGLKVN